MTPRTPKPTSPAKVRAKLPGPRVMLGDFDPTYDRSVNLQVFESKNEQANPDLSLFAVAVIPCRSRAAARAIVSCFPRTPEACEEMVNQGAEAISNIDENDCATYREMARACLRSLGLIDAKEGRK